MTTNNAEALRALHNAAARLLAGDRTPQAWTHLAHANTDALAALASQPQADGVGGDAVPVPREPTQGMIEAADRADEAMGETLCFATIYRAMIAAAPAPAVEREACPWGGCGVCVGHTSPAEAREPVGDAEPVLRKLRKFVTGWADGDPIRLTHAEAAALLKAQPQATPREAEPRGAVDADMHVPTAPAHELQVDAALLRADFPLTAKHRANMAARLDRIAATLAKPPEAAHQAQGAAVDEVEAVGAVLFRDWGTGDRSDGGPFAYYHGRIRDFIADLRNPTPARSGEAWRKPLSDAYAGLAAITMVYTPEALFPHDAIPREPVMDQVVRIRQALDSIAATRPDTSADEGESTAEGDAS